MQTTLLGLGIAIILALLAALIGPYFVDWSGYRAEFEARASQVLGAPVEIRGPIAVRLLPTPSVALEDIGVGRSDGSTYVRARQLAVAFALGPLMRGTWQATELRVDGAEVGLELGSDGRFAWPARRAGVDPDMLSIERLIVENGRVAFKDAQSGAQTRLERISFRGEARTLLGPIRGEGRFVADGQPQEFRVSLGRVSEEGDARLRFALEGSEQALALVLDGTLDFDRGKPRFDGNFHISREAGVGLVRGRAVAKTPWRLAGRLKADPALALVENFELAYGPEDRALRLSGTAEMKRGPHPRLEAVLSARQLDIDKFVALPEETRRLPLVALRTAASMVETAPIPPVAVRLGIGVDALTIGTAPVQEFRADLRSEGGGWEIESLEFRAPGVTRVRSSGRLSRVDQDFAFNGPASIESLDPRSLAAWLEGRKPPPATAAAPLRARGDVTVTPQGFAVARFMAELERNPIAGRFAYEWASATRPAPRLEAQLEADDVDIDAALSLVRTALPGSSLEVPGEVVLGLDLGRATLAGVPVSDMHAALRFDASGLVLNRLAIANLAGLSVTANGRVEGPWDKPVGALTGELSGKKLEGLAALLDRVAPKAAAWLRDREAALVPAALRFALSFDNVAGPEGGTQANLTVHGRAGALNLAVTGRARGEPKAWRDARVRTEGLLEATDGRTLAAFVGLDGVAGSAPGGGSLQWVATGPLTGSLAVQGQLSTPGAEISANGTLAFDGDGTGGMRADLSARLADVVPLRQAFGHPQGPTPLAFKAQASLVDDRLLLTGLSGELGDSGIGGQLTLSLSEVPNIEGRLTFDTLDVPALVAALAGSAGRSPSSDTVEASASGFARATFGRRFLGEIAADVDLGAMRARLPGRLEARDATATLRLKPGEAVLDNIAATFAGGRIEGRLSLQSGPLGTVASGNLAVTGAELGALWPGERAPPASGRVSLQIDLKGTGRSPADLVGSLGGSGTVTVEGLRVRNLSPDVFAAVTKMVDGGAGMDVDAVKAAVSGAIGKGQILVPRADGSLTVAGGQVRLGSFLASAGQADLAVNGAVDLLRAEIDARVALLGRDEEGGSLGRPEVDLLFRGPLNAPQRDVDASALVGWLTLRAVDMQAKRLKQVEAERRRAEEALKRANEEAERRAAEDAARKAAEARARQEAEEIMRTRTPEKPAVAPDQPPALPPPIEIQPAPGSRRSNAVRTKPQPAAERSHGGQPMRPPAEVPANGFVGDFLFRRQR
ncbi:MAG TPA: AsmA family protein [Xanthobacteraceae bacterium]|nr:AsmA family protein [Xanthobacteraceae bacterium]